MVTTGLLSLSEVSRLLGIKKRRLTYLIEGNRLPIIRIGRNIFIPEDKLEIVQKVALGRYSGQEASES